MPYRMILTIVFFSYTQTAMAALDCKSDGSREQVVYASAASEQISSWKPGAGIHKLTLNNHFAIGVKVEEASAEYYAKRFGQDEYVPELVKITFYDMNTDRPKELTHTWAGANSVQLFNAIGNADQVLELAEPGLTLNLIKQVCVKVGA
ncbi:hypothetical protein JAO78_015270 [Alishewanella sp. 16-MA]|uniref:Uncharacterized protein n=1 Tax=Alishewanella maricola TaxID=2795740 RepID=A0ABS8C769_9ALTE|nr:hypothetical protein [Alishewanella maricola]MCB5228169.1 hypothetical protein [Alishewanella maricola]